MQIWSCVDLTCVYIYFKNDLLAFTLKELTTLLVLIFALTNFKHFCAEAQKCENAELNTKIMRSQEMEEK